MRGRVGQSANNANPGFKETVIKWIFALNTEKVTQRPLYIGGMGRKNRKCGKATCWEILFFGEKFREFEGSFHSLCVRKFVKKLGNYTCLLGNQHFFQSLKQLESENAS